MSVILRAHPVRGESHIQRNASGEVATILTVNRAMLQFLQLTFIHKATVVTSKNPQREIC